MPPAPVCALDLHQAIDGGSKIRLGGTDTLNTPPALDSVWHYHHAQFVVTNVLSTYSRVVASAGCTVDVEYDTKIAPRYGFHTGTTKITPHADCGPGSCVSFEYLNAQYNAAGHCRLLFSDYCAA